MHLLIYLCTICSLFNDEYYFGLIKTKWRDNEYWIVSNVEESNCDPVWDNI